MKPVKPAKVARHCFIKIRATAMCFVCGGVSLVSPFAVRDFKVLAGHSLLIIAVGLIYRTAEF